MSKDLIIAILALAFAGCAAALLVVIAKWQEEKERRWDEISRAVDLENEIEQLRAREYWTAQAVLWYAESLKREKEILDSWKHEYEWLWNEKGKTQDKLSALLCPHNDHVWKDGRCVKCGRSQDD